MPMTSGNPRLRRRGQGQSWGRGRYGTTGGRAMGMPYEGPLRTNMRPSAFKIAKSFSRGKDTMRRNDLFEDSLVAAGLTGVETGTKLYISNLDYGVSNEDIKELFSEIGFLRRCAVHYDRNGRPNGSAEVMFRRRSDALEALKRYNNVQLDGKSMKIEVVGTNIGFPVTPRINVVGGASGRGRRTVVMTPEFGHGATTEVSNRRGGMEFGRGGTGSFTKRMAGRGRGGFHSGKGGRGRGRTEIQGGRGRGRGRGKKKAVLRSADDLDKDLDTYMNTS